MLLLLILTTAGCCCLVTRLSFPFIAYCCLQPLLLLCIVSLWSSDHDPHGNTNLEPSSLRPHRWQLPSIMLRRSTSLVVMKHRNCWRLN